MLSDSSVAFLLVGLGANYVLPVMNKWHDNRMFWFIQATQVAFGSFAMFVGLPGTETVPNVRLMAGVLFFGHFVHNFSKRMKVLAADQEDAPKPKLRIRPAEGPPNQAPVEGDAAGSDEAPPA